MDFKIKVLKQLGGWNFIYILALKTIDTLLSIISISLIYPLSSFIQNKEAFLDKIISVSVLNINQSNAFLLLLLALVIYGLTRLFFGFFYINKISSYIIGLRFKWLRYLLNYYTSEKNYYFTKSNDGIIISDWYNDTSNSSVFIEGLINIYSIFIYIFIFSVYLYFYDPFFLISVTLIFIFFISIWYLKRKKDLLSKSGDKLRQQQIVIQEISNVLQSRKDIIIFKIFDLAVVKLKDVIKSFSKTLFQNKVKASRTNLNSEIFIIVIILTLFSILNFSNLELNENKISELLVIIALGVRTTNYLNQVLNKLIKVSLEFVSFKNLLYKLNNTFESKLIPEKIEKIDSLVFENITYKIKNKKLFALDKITLEKGKHYLTIGPSGCGKSTFLDLIVGINPLQEGIIYFNYNDKKIKSNLNYYSYVSQNISIYGSNLEQMICGINKLDLIKLDRIKQICQIENISNKKSINNFSGGEKSRIGIARALYYDRPVIILDESLAFVEHKLEKEIITRIKINYPDKIIIQVIHERFSDETIDGKILFKNKTISLECN